MTIKELESLEFKSLHGGSSVRITSDGDTISIESQVGPGCWLAMHSADLTGVGVETLDLRQMLLSFGFGFGAGVMTKAIEPPQKHNFRLCPCDRCKRRRSYRSQKPGQNWKVTK